MGSEEPGPPLGTVLVTSRSFSTGDLDLRGELRAAGVEVVDGPPDHDLAALRDVLPRITAWIAGVGPVRAAHLDAAPRLRVLARYGVGVDAIDLPAAAGRGVMVANTPGANAGAVADHAMALLLAALRQVTAGNRRVRSGDWSVERARELSSLTVGIVGVGRVGREVARRLAGFGSALLAYDPGVPDHELVKLGLEPAGLAELARRSDVVTLHTPGESVLIDAAWLARARVGMLIINTARAVLVDEVAVAAALADGRLAGYAADTLSGEAGRRLDSPLLDQTLADVTIFTPHSAAQTVQAVDKMGRGATDAVLAVMRGGVPQHLVSGPGARRVGL